MEISPETLAAMIHGVTSRIARPDGTVPKSWEGISQDSRDMAVRAVESIMAGDPLTAEAGHELWMRLKIEAGWTCGPFCFENRTHPCIMPFDDLPISEKLKDQTWAALTELFRPYVKL